jgi:hypothetical protein
MNFHHFDTLKSRLLEQKGLKYTLNLNSFSILKDSTNQTTDDLFEGFGAVRWALYTVPIVLPKSGYYVVPVPGPVVPFFGFHQADQSDQQIGYQLHGIKVGKIILS